MLIKQQYSLTNIINTHLLLLFLQYLLKVKIASIKQCKKIQEMQKSIQDVFFLNYEMSAGIQKNPQDRWIEELFNTMPSSWISQTNEEANEPISDSRTKNAEQGQELPNSDKNSDMSSNMDSSLSPKKNTNSTSRAQVKNVLQNIRTSLVQYLEKSGEDSESLQNLRKASSVNRTLFKAVFKEKCHSQTLAFMFKSKYLQREYQNRRVVKDKSLLVRFLGRIRELGREFIQMVAS